MTKYLLLYRSNVSAQDQMANAVLKGIRKYFAKNPPLSKNKLT